MVRQVTERNTITLPKKVLKHLGVKPGDFLEISKKSHQIILRPKILSGKVFKSGKEAKRHLRRL